MRLLLFQEPLDSQGHNRYTAQNEKCCCPRWDSNPGPLIYYIVTKRSRVQIPVRATVFFVKSENFSYWDLNIPKLIKVRLDFKISLFCPLFQTCPMKGRPEDSFMDQFSERFMDHVRQVCTFAKLIPGFKCLHHDDQVTLLKSCVFEVLLVRLAGLFDSQVRILEIQFC